MTRKDFQLIAETLKAVRANDEVVKAMANSLATTNPRFNRERFIDAATYVPEPIRFPTPSGEKAEVLKRAFGNSECHEKYLTLYAKAA